LRRLRSHNGFAILAERCWRRRFCAKYKCVFPLLGQSFWIDVWVPYQAVGDYEWVGHAARSKCKARETLVAAIRLTDVNGVAVFFEGPAATGRATGCVVGNGHVR